MTGGDVSGAQRSGRVRGKQDLAAGAAELEQLAGQLDGKAYTVALITGDGRRPRLPISDREALRGEVRAAALERLRGELARWGITAWVQPGGASLGIWAGLYAGESANGYPVWVDGPGGTTD